MTAAEYFRQEGIEQGIEQGIEKRTLEIAVNALKQGFATETIADITELDTAKINQLKQKIASTDKL